MAERQRARRVSSMQLEILYDFLNSNKNIANACNRSTQEKEISKIKWREVAKILNAQVDGAYKDDKGWCKYWVDYKAKVKARATAVRSSKVWNGEDSSNERPLSTFEKKFLQIIEDYQDVPPRPAEMCDAIIDTDKNDSSAPQIICEITQPNENIPNPKPQIILVPLIKNPPPPTPSPPRSPKQSPPRSLKQSPPPSPKRSPPRSPISSTSAVRSPRHWRRKRKPMTQEYARRALVRYSQIRADAAVKTSEAMEKIVEKMTQFQDTAARIERFLNIAFPAVAEKVNST